MIFCYGPDKGTVTNHRCQCCGFESDNLDEFTIGGCWQCAFSMNEECDSCIESGMEVNNGVKVHRVLRRGRTVCGHSFEFGEKWTTSGCGDPFLSECKVCIR